MSHQVLSQRQMINRIFKDLCGFSIPKNEEQVIKTSKGSAVYGEITLASMDKLLNKLNLGPNDYFYDLGSGVGKLVLYTAINTPVKKSIGIELSESRHQEASIAYKRSLEWFPQVKNRSIFVNDDIMTANIKQPSVIYTCSTAFSIKFMKDLTLRLAAIKNDFRLVSLQELPKNKNFELEEILKLDMTWVRKTPVYVYQKIL